MLFQDSIFSLSKPLDEILTTHASKAILGAGAYAFVSIDGIKIYLKSSEFEEFIKSSKFTLIIGINAITDSRALDELKKLPYKNLKVKTYFKSSYELFHPKFSWFKYKDGTGKAITGSGNLTLRGLRKNIEAYTIKDLSKKEMKEYEEYWNKWIEDSKDYLRDLDDPFVIEQVERNELISKINKSIQTPIKSKIITKKNKIEITINEDDDINEEDNIWDTSNEQRVLICEPVKDRPGQFSIKGAVLSNFFGFENDQNKDTKRNIIINDGKNKTDFTTIKYKPKSINYYFELSELKEIKDIENTIVVLIEVAKKSYVYNIFTKDDDIVLFKKLSTELEKKNLAKSKSHKKWYVTSYNEYHGIIN